MDKHQKRKGVGCSYEWQDEPNTPIFCGYAEHIVGGYNNCLAPKDCWLDKKITKKFNDDLHCPNCSEPNKPFKLIIDDEFNANCPQCNFSKHKWEGD
jgi:hypothetical protein